MKPAITFNGKPITENQMLDAEEHMRKFRGDIEKQVISESKQSANFFGQWSPKQIEGADK